MSKNQSRWDTYINALTQYVNRENTARVPSFHIEQTDGGAVNLGAWVSYVRARYRAGLLPTQRVDQLNMLVGWYWESTRPGPRTDEARNLEIKSLRAKGVSLQKIGDVYGISRQRVHQIVSESK